jgi:hypothetical protein
VTSLFRQLYSGAPEIIEIELGAVDVSEGCCNVVSLNSNSAFEEIDVQDLKIMYVAENESYRMELSRFRERGCSS